MTKWLKQKKIDQFIPQLLSAKELKSAVANIIVKVGVKGPADMGKVMRVTSKELVKKLKVEQSPTL